MSNYATLKSAIQSVIKTNGNQEITGAILQNALLSIVDAIGAGYLFAGVATTQTNAGAPDQNVFYLAPAGEYTNFGDTYTVNNGNIGIFMYNGSWIKNTIPTVSAINSLDSTSTTEPLSANQGRTLYGKMKAMNGYYLCETAEGTTQKWINVPWFELITYATLMIKFTTGNTASAPTLNINGTGAKPLYINGVRSSATVTWKAGDVALVYYDGENFQAIMLGRDSSATKGSQNLLNSGTIFAENNAIYDLSAQFELSQRPLGLYKLSLQQYYTSGTAAISVNDDHVVFNAISNAGYYDIPVTYGEIYAIKSLSYHSSVGFIFADDDNKIIQQGAYLNANKFVLASGVYAVPKGATHLYINAYDTTATIDGTSISLKNVDVMTVYKSDVVRVKNNAKNNLTAAYSLTPVDSFNGFFMYSRPIAIYTADNTSDYVIDIYEVSAGQRLEFDGYNSYDVAGYYLTDYGFNKLDASTASYAGEKDAVNAIIDITQGGFLFAARRVGHYSYSLRISSPASSCSTYAKLVPSLTDGSVYDGSITSASGYSYAELSVGENDNMLFTGTMDDSHPFITIVDANGNVLSEYNAGASSATQNTICLLMPKDANKAYVNTLTAWAQALEVSRLIRSAGNGRLKGVRWCAMGDSLTAKSTLGNLYNYTDYIIHNEGTEATNKGVGGTGFWNGGNFTHGTDTFYNRANTLTDTYDVITVFGSFNDLYADSQQGIMPVFGEAGDTGTDTLAGCMYNTIVNIREKCPNASIGIIAPTPWSTRNNVSGEYEHSVGWAERYVVLLQDVCKKYCVPFLDLYHYSGLYPWDADCLTMYYHNADGTHPNSVGHRRFIYPKVAEFIKSLI